MVSFTPRPLYPQGKSPWYPLDRRLGGPQTYVSEIIGDHQCGFHYKRSTMDQISYIRQILEKKWEHNGMVHQLFIDFRKAYD
jgi:hypothetical protein